MRWSLPLMSGMILEEVTPNDEYTISWGGHSQWW
jgi:hypothetical protein